MSEATPNRSATTSSTGIPACPDTGRACVPSVTPPTSFHQPLTTYTSARVSLQQTGHALATTEILQLQLAAAQARDAVHASLDISALIAGLTQRKLPHVVLTSAANNRADYLRNPTLGRTLNSSAESALKNLSVGANAPHSYDLAVVIADGLSALAVDRHALPLLDAVLPLLDPTWRVAPIALVEQARVAIADPIGELLHAQLSVILIGERPGLSSPDSLGVYITWHPRPGRTDAERNCISNIRPEGLSYAEAARLLHFYLTESRRLQQSGTLLKPSSVAQLPLPSA